MSSTTGGPPPQEEAAMLRASLHHQIGAAEAAGGPTIVPAEGSTSLSPTGPQGSSELFVDSGAASTESRTSSSQLVSSVPQVVDQDREVHLSERPESETTDTRVGSASQAETSVANGPSEGRESNENGNEGALEASSKQNGAEAAVGEINDERQRYVVEHSQRLTDGTSEHDATLKQAEEIVQTPPLLAHSRRRVKVYTLKQGVWDDRGTGSVDIRAWDPEPELVVISEADPSVTLLESRIIIDDVYQKQQDSLIVWNEPREGLKDGIDLAISFQEAQGCSEIWDRIKEIQMRYARNHRGHRLGGPGSSNSIEGEFDDLFCKSDDDDDDNYHSNSVSSTSRLPPATPKNLDDILHICAELFMLSKVRMGSIIIRNNYIEALCELFKMVEDLGNLRDLHKLFEIFKMLVMLNQPRIIDKLFHPSNVFQVMGALEYDPELARRPQHRKFLEEEVVFTQVVTLSPQLIEQIHRSFRIQYMKDVVLPRILDETTFAFLNSVVMFANTKIVGLVRDDDSILTELFDKMKNPATTNAHLRDLLRFLNELCDLSKNLEQESKITFYATLHDHGLLDVLQRTMEIPEMSLVSVEILLASIDTDGRLLRKYIMKHRGENSILATLIRRLHQDEDTAVKNVISDLMRYLVDVDSIDGTSERNEFLTVFYADHLENLLAPMLTHPPADTPHKPMSDQQSLLVLSLIEFVGFLLMHHGSRAKSYIVQHRVLVRMNPLIGYPEKHIALAAIRNLRLIVGLKDKSLISVIVKENLLARVVKLFLMNSDRYNLVNSACLDLFTLIRKDASGPMIFYFVTNFYDQLKHITYTDIFTLFKSAFDEAADQSSAASDYGDADTPPLHYSSSMGRTGPSLGSHHPENEKFQRSMEELEYFEDTEDDPFHSSVSPNLSPLQPVSPHRVFGDELELYPDTLPGTHSESGVHGLGANAEGKESTPPLVRYAHHSSPSNESSSSPQSSSSSSYVASSTSSSSSSNQHDQPAASSSSAQPNGAASHDSSAAVAYTVASMLTPLDDNVQPAATDALSTPPRDLAAADSVNKKRKSPTFDDTPDAFPPSKRPKSGEIPAAEPSVDTPL